ncbi:conserved Plasmodium protein, unknown function [Plasmodium knowlesi strain H]|uniref:Uncharacterized protein n=3 Tax=Plasmodium knowlesi TaxID=5850 RepID=A0A5K1VN01_PLAKH|nr:conserved Plasmodium protein, unknown function [Plasmodium knowlesi strain H]OTN64365.1 Uncharacterized protein PKNOH_S130189300 [Plasmodium knowlesi]CAA9989056.1 conserved Plasmodium protein, unknown function [Plasmodium knowlesi strain H]SBO27268.1 conserved Plasmodium protein, unknown function [Plasmodium knowlesi strain H]SBO28897.1 conserved Plasmodium protein, unknown function [Plasmodium knowlesi strain H]VVS78530.1 conserved Plasmodium protein, unknown function [Plasmodium knowlesi |eukprot:XP_002261405.1 hypothetical protein, conserved in Plasmodium species [Plasmodium knowlesi strain H]
MLRVCPPTASTRLHITASLLYQMEREVDCQTDSVDLSEEITISEKLNSILVAYTKNMILHNPAESSQDEHVIKKNIYEWSKEYFQKLYEEKGGDGNKADDGDSQTTSSATRIDGHSVKDQIKKEMERVNFDMGN